MKLCKDCEYAKPFQLLPFIGGDYKLGKCTYPHIGINPTDGSAATAFCSTMRLDLTHMPVCGPEGKWFTERKPLWLRIVKSGAGA